MIDFENIRIFITRRVMIDFWLGTIWTCVVGPIFTSEFANFFAKLIYH